jgi:hypothetical protein
MSEINNGREYRYQADWSIGTRMFHVRCDDWEDFKEACENMETILPATEDFPNDKGNMAKNVDVSAKQNPTCPRHGATTKWLEGVSKKTGKPYSFWSCSAKNKDGSWCSAQLINPKE